MLEAAPASIKHCRLYIVTSVDLSDTSIVIVTSVDLSDTSIFIVTSVDHSDTGIYGASTDHLDN
jgi:hypothetical protein